MNKPKHNQDHSVANDMVELDANLERLRQVVVEKNRKFGRHGFERKDRIIDGARMPYSDD